MTAIHDDTIGMTTGVDEPILQVRDLVKEFPIRSGVFRRQVGAVQAVSGVSFDARRRGRVGLWQVDPRSVAAAVDRADIGTGVVHR
jgi:ABC-type glutathione transport system ATPase component